LLKKFRSISKVKEQSLQALQEEIGLAKATLVFNYFNGEKEPE